MVEQFKGFGLQSLYSCQNCCQSKTSRSSEQTHALQANLTLTAAWHLTYSQMINPK